MYVYNMKYTFSSTWQVIHELSVACMQTRRLTNSKQKAPFKLVSLHFISNIFLTSGKILKISNGTLMLPA